MCVSLCVYNLYCCVHIMYSTVCSLTLCQKSLLIYTALFVLFGYRNLQLQHFVLLYYSVCVYMYVCVLTCMAHNKVLYVFVHRLVVCLRRTRAAVCLQRHARGLVARLQFQRLRSAVLTTQALFRGRQARKVSLKN